MSTSAKARTYPAFRERNTSIVLVTLGSIFLLAGILGLACEVLG